MGKIKGVIFDFNGTLFWDTDLHNRAWDSFLEKHGIKLSNNEKNKAIHGKNNQEILNNLLRTGSDKALIDKLILEKESLYQELCSASGLELAPGAEGFLTFLKSHNLPFTIATASGIENVDFYFRHLKLDRFFDRDKVAFNTGNTKSKPDPELFSIAINNLAMKAEYCLIFEDSPTGIEAAQNARPGEIIIVDSGSVELEHWSYTKIKNFDKVDRKIFDI